MNETKTYTFLNADYVAAILREIPKDSIFTVVFEKRTTGELRTMTCRRGVRKGLKGGKSTIASHAELKSVYDMVAKGYRCFDIEQVVMIRAEGFELRSRDYEPVSDEG